MIGLFNDAPSGYHKMGRGVEYCCAGAPFIQRVYRKTVPFIIN